MVRRSDADATAYRRALRVADATCRLAPNNGVFLNTLGVAQYRAEKYEGAAATLTRSDRLNAQPPLGSIPTDLAFLALVDYRLGQTEPARDTLRRLREAMKKPQHAKDPKAAGLLRKAEVVEQDQVFPADPFAR